MPCSFDFDWKHRVFRLRLQGRVTGQELKEMYGTAYQIVFRIQPLALIADGSQGTSFDISPEAVRDLAKAAPVLPNPDLLRIIIAPSPAFYGLARMFEMQGEATRPNLHVVRSEQEAFALLDIKNPRFEPVDAM